MYEVTYYRAKIIANVILFGSVKNSFIMARDSIVNIFITIHKDLPNR